MNLFISYLLQDPFYFFAWVGVVTFSICFHEYSHASMALKLGDDTAARMGHLSLNPMVQMGPTSLVMLLLLGIAWGAVPVNVSALRSRKAAAVVSFAGPAANLLLSLVFGALAAGLLVFRTGISEPDYMERFLAVGCVANGVLFVFNMLPIPLFDGWAVFSLFIPRMRSLEPQQAGTISWIAMLLLFFTPVAGLVWAVGEGLADLTIQSWIRFLAWFVRA